MLPPLLFLQMGFSFLLYSSLTKSCDNISKLHSSNIFLNLEQVNDLDFVVKEIPIFSSAFSDKNYASGIYIIEPPLSCNIPKKSGDDVLLSTDQIKTWYFLF